MTDSEESDPPAPTPAATWGRVLEPYNSPNLILFGLDFLQQWGGKAWLPRKADRHAAGKLHTQLISRIATQPLHYRDGDEAAALKSVHDLFEKTRTIGDAQFGATCFETLAWHILNSCVRPFTAKWHRRSLNGAFDALDATDEFRAELSDIRAILIRFDELLVEIRDGARLQGTIAASTPGDSIKNEMAQPLPFGLSEDGGDIPKETAEAMNAAEKAAIENRRQHYEPLPNTQDASGLALSGGGIRSATFSLGVLIALARRNLLPQFDYLSTVSGGGYIGSFLTAYLATPPNKDRPTDIGLRSGQLPFQRLNGEPDALRYIRHRCKYLRTSLFERLTVASAQFYGMACNFIWLALLAATVAAGEFFCRPTIDSVASKIQLVGGLAFDLVLITIVLIFSAKIPKVKAWLDEAALAACLGFIIVALWLALGRLHGLLPKLGSALQWSYFAAFGVSLAIAAIGLLGGRFPRDRKAIAFVAGLSAPFLMLAMELLTYQWLQSAETRFEQIEIGSVALVGVLAGWFAIDVNFTAPHRHYRKKLAETFLIQPTGEPGLDRFEKAAPVKLSAAAKLGRGPYHLINAALNVPGSKNPAMQGRLTDFFLFGPDYVGSPLTGYVETSKWESADPNLDLATAMAVSGAATSPLMGLSTRHFASFWLALLNIRLGYWVRKPESKSLFNTPGMGYLFREMLGNANEQAAFLNVTDGGHIENLGVYELLRRRCKYIVAVDGEHDPGMTFQALTTLQRLAAIDLNVAIDIDVDDLRLGAKGLSRSHFQFCRIRYPQEQGRDGGIGYLIYLKLSLTGNEGEFLRRYRLDEPNFPHHPTSDQFFTEAQFEAYRSLGEHVGDKLFLRAIVGSLSEDNSIGIGDWFAATGESMLSG